MVTIEIIFSRYRFTVSPKRTVDPSECQQMKSDDSPHPHSCLGRNSIDEKTDEKYDARHTVKENGDFPFLKPTLVLYVQFGIIGVTQKERVQWKGGPPIS